MIAIQMLFYICEIFILKSLLSSSEVAIMVAFPAALSGFTIEARFGLSSARKVASSKDLREM